MSEDSDSSNSLHTIEDSEIEDPNSNFVSNFLMQFIISINFAFQNRTFDYVDWHSSPNIIRAVLKDDINAVREFLKIPNAIDSRDQLNNSPLHIVYVHQKYVSNIKS